MCATVFAAGATVARTLAYARTPFQIDYEEGNILNAALRITRGETPYSDPQGWPIVLNPYGPVMYYAVAGLVKIFGLGFVVPRMLVIGSTLAIGLIIALLIRRDPAPWSMAVAFGAIYIALPPVATWMGTLRVDLPAVALGVAGLYAFVRRPARWWLAVVLFVTALFCKHTLLAPPAACALWLAIHRDWRRLRNSLALGAALSLAGFAVIQVLTHGAFAFALFATHADPYSLQFYWSQLREPLISNAPLLATGGAFVAWSLWTRRASLALLYLLTTTIATFTLGKLGSNTNHLLEWFAAACWAAGVLFAAILKSQRWPVAATITTCLMAAVLGFTTVRDRAGYDPRPLITDCALPYQLAAATDGPVLSENMGALLLAGKPVLVSNPFVYTQLVRAGKRRDQYIEQRVRSREFGLLLMSDTTGLLRQRWPDGVLAAVGEHYVPVAHFRCMEAKVAYRPR